MKEVVQQKEFVFSAKWTYPWFFVLFITLIMSIVLLIVFPILAIFPFLVFLAFFAFLCKKKQANLVINPREVRFEKGFFPVIVKYEDVHTIEYYTETVNFMNTDYYVKFILKNGRPVKKTLRYWKVPYSFDPEIYLRTIIEAYLMLYKKGITKNEQQLSLQSPQFEKKYCTKCGSDNSTKSKYCTYCGTQLN
ncbi:MAG: zinc ribbon domain-containing protein [Promethearchaeota archaeon]|nr:MAG: zinc ribbon domain-containing protein [Candidatus Lokiarchaeota archaeon]